MSIKHLLARRRPSPAMLVACCALFVALGGTSYAVAVGSVGSREIRDGSIRALDIRPDGLGGGAIKEEKLDASKVGTVGLAEGATGLALHAMVDLTGRVARARGVADVNHLHAGIYQVIFNRDVSACVPAATIFSDIPGPGEISAQTYSEEPRTVYVETRNSAGTFTDQTFSLLVSC